MTVGGEAAAAADVSRQPGRGPPGAPLEVAAAGEDGLGAPLGDEEGGPLPLTPVKERDPEKASGKV